MSKPSVTAEVGLVEPETDPMTAVAAGSTTSPEVVIGSTPSMFSMGKVFLMMVSMTVLMADGAMSMAMSMAVLMADGALSMAVSMADGALLMAVSMAVVGEGAGESVDPDHIVPIVGAN
jgi:hypothetical protein